MASSRSKGRRGGKRPTATIDAKATEVREAKPAAAEARGVDTKAVRAKAAHGQTGDGKPGDAGSSAKPAGAASAGADAASAGGTVSPASRGPAVRSGPVTFGAETRTASTPKDDSKLAATPSGFKPRTDAKPTPTNASKTDSAKPATARGPKVESAAAPSRVGGTRGFTGMVSHLAAGAAGALLVLFGAGQWSGGAGTTQTEPVNPALAGRLAQIEEKLGAANAGTSGPAIEKITVRIQKLEALEARIAGLDKAQTTLRSSTNAIRDRVKQLGDPQDGEAAKLRSRITSLEGTLNSIAKSAADSKDSKIPQLAAIGGRINDLQTELEAKLANQRQQLVASVDARMQPLLAGVKAGRESDAASAEAIEALKVGGTRVTRGLEGVKSDLDRVGTAVADVAKSHAALDGRVKAGAASLSALDLRLVNARSAMNRQIAALPKSADIEAAVAPVTGQLAKLQSNVSTVIEREKARANSAQQIVLALELSNLRRAVDRGQPVGDQIARIRSTAPKTIDLSAINDVGDGPLTTLGELRREFRSVERQALNAESSARGDGIFDRLLSNARTIVRVRKTGEVAGDGSGAILTRAENALRKGDLSAAVTELGALEGSAGEAVKGWMKRANDRLAIEKTIALIEQQLKSAIGAGGVTN